MIKCGTSEVCISPNFPVEISGWQFGESKGVADDLFMSIVVLDDNQRKIAVASLDIIGLKADYVQKMRQSLKDTFQINELLVCTSHTHSGPAGINLRGSWGTINEAYMNFLNEQILLATDLALNNSFEAHFSSQTIKSGQ